MINKYSRYPKVSIGLPVYNGEKYLNKTLKNLLEQSFTDIEIIISDDGSSDRTKDICKEYSDKDPRIRYFRQNNNFGMPVKNFRFVFDNAIGEYFMFASHDDSWNQKYIEELVNILDNNLDCSLAFSNYKIKNLLGEGEINVEVSSSVSNSKYTRYLSRIIETVPALIFGLFRKNLISSEDLILADHFEFHFGNLMALKGKIKILDKYMMNWGIEGSRSSYSVNGKIPGYRKYYIKQLEIIMKNFNFLKWPLPILYLSFWMVKLWIKRRIFPQLFNIKFN